MNKAFVQILGLVVLFGSLTACVSSGNPDPYQNAWYTVYGTACGNFQPRPGCDYYFNGMKIRDYQDPFYYSANYSNGIWFSPTGIMYDEFGDALNEQKDNAEESADVIAQAALQEKQIAIAAGKDFAQKYALAEDKGILISQTLQSWAVLGADRARTDSDMNEVTIRIYGMDLNRVKSAMTKAGLEELNVDVAAHWGTSPEVSKQILKRWYSQELASFGI